MEGLPDEGTVQCRGHSTNMKDYTHQAYTHSFQQGGEYEVMIMMAKHANYKYVKYLFIFAISTFFKCIGLLCYVTSPKEAHNILELQFLY